jgi:hypothetical protein
MMLEMLQESPLLASFGLVHNRTHQILADDEVAIQAAGGLLKPACSVHGVADHGKLDVPLGADITENSRTIV